MLKNLTIIEFGAWSNKRGLPYFEIASEDILYSSQRNLNPQDTRQAVGYLRSQVYYGRIDNCLQIGTTSLFATDDDYLLCYGLTYRDYDFWYFLNDQIISRNDTSCVLDLDLPTTTIEEECIYFGGDKNFGHFIFEHLSRLAVIASVHGSENKKLAVFNDLPDRYFEMLERAGYGKDRIILIPRAKTIEFKRVWVPSCPFYRDQMSIPHVWPTAYHYLRWKIASGLRKDHSVRRPKLFLSRSNTKNKRIVNEVELFDVLRAEGFMVVDLATLSISEQLSLVTNAEIIAGPVGAAMAITIFAPEDCAVIELHPEANIAGIYNSIGQAHWLNQPYHRIKGKRVLLEDNKMEEAIYHDFSINAETLREELKAAQNTRWKR